MLVKIVLIEREVLQNLSASAQEDVYLLGGEPGEKVSIRVAVPVRGVYRAGRFEIPPEELQQAIRVFDEIGVKLVGVYHSHDHGGNSPSPLDILGMSASGLLWLIRSGDILKAWVTSGRRVLEVPLAAEGKQLPP